MVNFSTNLSHLLVGDKHLNCYPLYFMLLGATKQNILRKSRYYLTVVCNDSPFPHNTLHYVTLGRKFPKPALLRATSSRREYTDSADYR